MINGKIFDTLIDTLIWYTDTTFRIILAYVSIIKILSNYEIYASSALCLMIWSGTTASKHIFSIRRELEASVQCFCICIASLCWRLPQRRPLKVCSNQKISAQLFARTAKLFLYKCHNFFSSFSMNVVQIDAQRVASWGRPRWTVAGSLPPNNYFAMPAAVACQCQFASSNRNFLCISNCEATTKHKLFKQRLWLSSTSKFKKYEYEYECDCNGDGEY